MKNQQWIKSQTPSTRSYEIKNVNYAMKTTNTEQKTARLSVHNTTTVKDIITSRSRALRKLEIWKPFKSKTEIALWNRI